MSERNRNLDELNDWLQVVATVGVIASIVFLGFELRQNSDLMRAQIYQSRAETIMGAFLDMQDSEYMVPILVKLETAEDNGATVADTIALLTPEERMRYTLYHQRIIRHLDNMYYQNELGLIDEEYMDWWVNLVRSNGEHWLALFGNDISGRSSFVEEVRRIYPALR